MYDGLFQALAQAKSQPSKGLRAVVAGGQAAQDTIGGYMEGKQLKQQLDQYRLLSTPLGSMYSDPSQIPFGLGPQHTVKDLLTLAPAMENFAPANLMSGVAQQYGANVNQPNNGPSMARVPTQAPAPTIASTDMNPIPGAEGPAPTPGTQTLDSDEGTGAGTSGVVPQGTSIPAPVPASPSLNIPPGGMGMGAFKNLVIPALNAAREGRQFQQGQASEESRFERGQANENNRFVTGKIGDETSKLAPEVETIGSLKTFVNTLNNLVAKNHPIPGLGNMEGNISKNLGGYGTAQMKNSRDINDAANGAAAVLDKKMAGRFNKEEADVLKKVMLPTGNDNPQYGGDKLAKLNAFVKTLDSGNVQAMRNMAAALTGGQVDVTSHAEPVQTTTSFGNGWSPAQEARYQYLLSRKKGNPNG